MKDTNHTQSEERRVAEALEAMRKDAGDAFKLEAVNLAEMERRTGLSRSRLRRLKKNGFQFKPHANKGRKAKKTILSGFTGALDDLLRKGVSNSSVILERLKELGYPGGLTVVKEYIARHKDLLPPKRQVVAPQGNRGRRYETPPGDSFQMDWGFTNVVASAGGTFQCACFVMTCHHCGACYVEFFPNAKQENLFIGMIHGFERLGVPAHVLTDNMKSVVLHRDLEGQPVWHSDYDAFMHTVGFQTKLCKPRHPFTKGKVERLVRFVKENFLAGRTFYNVTDLNRAALEWCDKQNGIFHRGSALPAPQDFLRRVRELRRQALRRPLPVHGIVRARHAEGCLALHLLGRPPAAACLARSDVEQARPFLQRPVRRPRAAGGVPDRAREDAGDHAPRGRARPLLREIQFQQGGGQR